jgi:hypothetical protein
MMFLIYFTLPTTSSIIMKCFSCRMFAEEGYLVADLALLCDGEQYRTAYGYAIAMAIMFPLGMPIAAFFVLRSRQNEIVARDTRLGGPELAAISFLFQHYTPENYMVAILDLLRRLLPAFYLLPIFSKFALLVTAPLVCLVTTMVSAAASQPCPRIRIQESSIP